MSSIIKVNTIQDIDGNNIINESGNVITIGASGDTITVPAGATVSGFTSAGIDDNATSTAITISSGEDVTFTENILLGDNKKAKFGTGNDLEIFHDGSSSIISDVGTGRLILRSDGDGVDINKGTSENIAKFRSDAGVELYYDNSKKFETTSSGVTVTGNINLGDSNVINLGASNDLQIFHSNSGSFIKDAGTSNLFIDTDGNAIELTSGGTAESMARFVKDGAVELYHNDSKKFETLATGIYVSGVAELYAFGEPPSTGMLQLQANSTQRQLRFSPPSNNQNGFIDYRGGNLLLKDDGTEVARFQGSTGFLVGTTDINGGVTSSSVKGISLRNEGYIFASIANDAPLTINRQSSDGNIAQFRKNGTTVGAIGIQSSGFFIDGESGHEGIRFANGTVTPRENGSDSDNASDLGATTNRWKDIYLGGGAFLGGTGSANKLDDYEEGTWTPSVIYTGGQTATLSNGNATYTKIGRVVICNLYFAISNTNGGSGNVRISNLPFTVDDILTPTGLEASGSVGYWSGFSTAINFLSITADQSNILIPQCSTGNATVLNTLTATQLGTGEMRASIAYITSQ